MQKENFSVQNVKCGGCVNNIRNGLLKVDGVDNVEVEIEGGAVSVNGTGLSREILSAKLEELGYPEV